MRLNQSPDSDVLVVRYSIIRLRAYSPPIVRDCTLTDISKSVGLTAVLTHRGRRSSSLMSDSDCPRTRSAILSMAEKRFDGRISRKQDKRSRINTQQEMRRAAGTDFGPGPRDSVFTDGKIETVILKARRSR